MSAERELHVDRATADPAAMHTLTPEIEHAAEGVIDYVRDRLHAQPRKFATARTPAEMQAAAGETVTDDGIGADAALRLFAETLAPASVPVENPRFLAFIPTAPTPAAKLFDMALSATPMYAGSWRSSAGRSTPRTRRCAGWPTWPGSGDGGRLLRPGRHRRKPVRAGGRRGTPTGPSTAAAAPPLRVAATGEAHSSVAHGARRDGRRPARGRPATAAAA